MKLIDRVRAWLLRAGIAYDEPTLIILDEDLVNDMHAGLCSVVVSVRSHRILFPQPAPLGDQ